MLRDVTDRIKAQEAIQEKEALLRATLESTADGILVVNDQGDVTHANARFAEMWRIPESLLAKQDDNKLLEYVLNQLLDPEAFLAKVRQLYGSVDESFDTLYFKTGDANRTDYEEAGMSPFTYQGKSKPVAMSYHEVPPDVLEDPDTLSDWAVRAFDVALKAKKPKPPRSQKRRKKS